MAPNASGLGLPSSHLQKAQGHSREIMVRHRDVRRYVYTLFKIDPQNEDPFRRRDFVEYLQQHMALFNTPITVTYFTDPSLHVTCQSSGPCYCQRQAPQKPANVTMPPALAHLIAQPPSTTTSPSRTSQGSQLDFPDDFLESNRITNRSGWPVAC